MTETPIAARVSPVRRHSFLATLALVGVLVAGSAAVPAQADVVGSGPGTISGTVASAESVPLENVLVNVSVSAGESTSFSAAVWSDANGYFEFSGLDIGDYSISAYATGYQSSAWQYPTVTAESPVVTVNFELAPFEVGAGTISGLVTADGAPLAGASVSAANYSTNQNLNAVTNENGVYQFTELATGEWNVNAFAGFDYQYLFVPSVFLTEASPSATADFPFISWPTGTSSISGVVTDAATGQPIPFTSVLVYSEDAPHNSNATTDENGAYSVEQLPTGLYSLSISSFGYLWASADIQLSADQTAVADFALLATNAAIRGHIKDKDGNPLVGIYVGAHSADGAFGDAMTDENGDYVMNSLGPVEYTISVGGVGTPYKQKSKDVTALANTTVKANFTLAARTTGYITGAVFAPDGEYYTQAVCAYLYSSKNKKVIAETRTYGENYGDGTYSFDNVKPGSYTVKFLDCDDDPTTKYKKVFLGGAHKYAEASFITIIAGQDSYDNNVTLTARGKK